MQLSGVVGVILSWQDHLLWLENINCDCKREWFKLLINIKSDNIWGLPVSFGWLVECLLAEQWHFTLLIELVLLIWPVAVGKWCLARFVLPVPPDWLVLAEEWTFVLLDRIISTRCSTSLPCAEFSSASLHLCVCLVHFNLFSDRECSLSQLHFFPAVFMWPTCVCSCFSLVLQIFNLG